MRRKGVGPALHRLRTALAFPAYGVPLMRVRQTGQSGACILRKASPDERAVSCKNCRHYILEADIRKRDLALDGAAIVSLGMGYLDALMQEQGILPLVNLYSAKMVAQKKAAKAAFFYGRGERGSSFRDRLP